MKQIIQDMPKTEQNIIRKIPLPTGTEDSNVKIIFFHHSKQDITVTEHQSKWAHIAIITLIIIVLTEQDISFCQMLI